MIVSWLKDRVVFLLFLAAVFAVLLCVPLLYADFRSVIVYCSVLIGFIAAVLLAADYLRYRAYMKELEQLSGEASIDADHLPRPYTQADRIYAERITGYSREYARLQEKTEQQGRDLRDTYVLWAHQIKTPIAAMRLLLDDRKDPDLSEQLFHIEEYVSQLLYYFRSERISSDFVIRTCEIDPIIQASLRRYSLIFIRRKLKLDYQPTGLTADTDEKWLGFVIEQILSNATKYTKEGGIRIYADNGDLVIEDTGIGIAKEDLDRIFDKGYTGLNGRQENRSTGLGLYLCRQITEKLGHRITIDSEKGVGTAVRIILDPDRS